ncbi:MAG: ribosome biogenesis GTPase Der [Candidatus Kapabacteria bacterium]|nr:ribosome biogenesis GTPase Der [Candidatus Kapabacteria bacterium]MBX7154688.1 ribosome biogenesis GTPase Der [Bacteroidota bacterium]
MNVIAIVGRPNVGKSTLFNRIIERREAIVESEPGVTRDRLYAQAEWNGIQFTLIDTGGIVPDSNELFDKAIREQAILAIHEADSILFVVDAVDGIMPTDEEIAKILRGSDKPVILCANKSDNASRDADSMEFYSLGLGEVFPISALNGRNTGDFLDAAVEAFSKEKPEEDSRLKIAVVGRPNVGKSSITNALLGKDRMIVTPVAGTTRDAIDSVLKYYGKEFILIDTAGLRRKSAVKENIEMYSVLRTMRAIERCDVAIVMLDATLGLEHQDKQIIHDVVEQRKGVIIAVNKWDLIEKDEKTADNFTKNLREQLAMFDFIPVVYVSALTKQRITKLVEMAEQIQIRRTSRTGTSLLNDILLDEISRTPPPAVKAQDLRINYITQVKTEPPVFAFFTNHPDLMPDSYKRFLERALRRHVDLEGVPVSFIFRKKNRRRTDDD